MHKYNIIAILQYNWMIRKRSKKRQALDRLYNKRAREWKVGKMCVCGKEPCTDVHHAKGKQGYADDYARLNDLPLLLDERFWVPVGRECHVKIETNPAWAKKMGYSLSRLEKKEYPPNFKMIC